MYPNLNLPNFSPRLRREKEKLFIYDLVRKKFMLLTPEEWVRQHFINFLLTQQYSLSLLSVEKGHQLNKLSKRTDIVAYNREGKIFLLVECKASNIILTQTVFEQIFVYNLTLQAPFIAITNGLQHYYFEKKENAYQEIESLPKFFL
jgi:type I site-specific restriction endonuclease